MMKSTRVGGETTAASLRIQLTAVAEEYSALIEEAADEIRLESDNPEIRRNAQLWKINAVPAIQSALFVPDPGAAALETWVFCIQMQEYFESDRAFQELGEWQERPQAVSRLLEARTETFIRRLTAPGDFSRARDIVQDWASRNPIADLSFNRELFIAELARGTFGRDLEGLEGLGALSTTAQDLKLLQSRLNLFNRYMTRSIRWEVELFSDELAGTADLEEVQEGLTRFSDVLTRLAASLETLPDFISSETEALYSNAEKEREIALEAISDFEQSTQQYLTNFRLATEEFLRIEREALAGNVSAERIALIEALEDERSAIVASLEREREAIFRETEAVSNRLIDRSKAEAENLIDRIFLWILGLMVLVAVVFLTGIWLFRRKRAGS